MKGFRRQTTLPLVLMFLGWLFPDTFQAQPTAVTGVVNAAAAIANVDTVTNTLALANPADAALFTQGDLVLIYQTQGATIQTGAANVNFGTISDIGGAGSFELGRVCAIDGGEIAIDNKLVQTYTSAQAGVQLIRVPEYSDAEITGTVTAPAWNGSTGGVVALSVLDTLYLNGTIDVSELGFRGGTAVINTLDNCNLLSVAPSYSYPSPLGAEEVGAKKGEGIAAFTANAEYGRGPQANGGGGGNGHNAGGGGGSNASAGGIGGERVALFYLCQGDFPGLQGKSLAAFGYSAGNQKAFFGGGGGAGEKNNNALSSEGGDGGGMVLIMANVITGTGSILSKGQDVLVYESDGGGGGGAGGSILLNANTIDGGGLTFEATGGLGGNTKINCEGPGGGGAGGVIWSSVPLGGAATNVGGGAAGQAEACANNNQGAAAGSGGVVLAADLAPPAGITPVSCVLASDIVLSALPRESDWWLSWTPAAEAVSFWQLETRPGLFWQKGQHIPAGDLSLQLPATGELTVRIAAHFADGRVEWSNAVELNRFSTTTIRASASEDRQLQLHRLPATEAIHVTLFDLQGRMLLSRSFQPDSDQLSVDLPPNQFPMGHYFGKWVQGNQAGTFRFLLRD